MQPQRHSSLPYQIFLLSLWAEPIHTANGCSVWRFSLENPHTGQRLGFKNLAALVKYLHQQTTGGDEEQTDAQMVNGKW